MRPDTESRAAALLAVLFLAGLLVAAGPGGAPSAHAGESGSPVQGNYVALDKPARVLNKTFTTTTATANTVRFNASGVAGVPRVGTTAVVAVTTINTNNTGNASITLCSLLTASGVCHTVWGASSESNAGPVSLTVTLPVDATKTTNQVKLTTSNKAVTARVDVVGYYTSSATGGGFVATRQTTVLDTRVAPEVILPAGQSITRKLTGGIIPEGSSAAYLNLAAGSITAAGSVIAVPAPVDPATAYPVMTFWNGAGTRADMAVVKLPPDGRVTFKNTSTKPVHLIVRAQGYATPSVATGADFQVLDTGENADSVGLGPNESGVLPVAGRYVFSVPANNAGVAVNISVYPIVGAPTGSGYLRIYPKNQAAAGSMVNFNASTAVTRRSAAIVVPSTGTSGEIVVENVSGASLNVVVDLHGYFAAPTGYATAGGDSTVGVARTSAGPCYGYLDRATQAVRATCAEDYDQAGLEAVWTSLAAPGEKFRGPVAVAARPGGRFVVAAVHVPDGEVWTWEFAHTVGALPPTPPIRTYRRVKTPVVVGSLPDGKPVGFTTDVQGRFWAIDLDVTSPEQPHWKALDVPAAAATPTGDLTTITTPDGIRLAGPTAAGDVVTGRYAGGTTTTLDWQSLGATGAASRVGLGLSQAGEVRAAVRHGDGTITSARLDTAGATVDGWHPVGLSFNGSTVVPSGSPSVVYDPQTGLNGVLVRSGSVGTGALYRVWETTPGSGDFSGELGSISLYTAGIASDTTAWDYRTDEPLYRRWSFLYLDSNDVPKIGVSYAS